MYITSKCIMFAHPLRGRGGGGEGGGEERFYQTQQNIGKAYSMHSNHSSPYLLTKDTQITAPFFLPFSLYFSFAGK